MTTTCPNHPDIATALASCSRCGTAFCPDCLIQLQGKAVCATCKSQDVLDIRSNAAADDPALALLASRWSRLFAAIIDTFVFMILLSPFWVPNAFHSFQSGGKPVAASVTYLICTNGCAFLYEFLMLAAFSQTLGKMAMRVRVVQQSGERLTPRHALVRALFRTAIGALVNLGGAGLFLPMIDPLFIFGKQRRCLHDFCAQTKVVKQPRLSAQAADLT